MGRVEIEIGGVEAEMAGLALKWAEIGAEDGPRWR
jgi:hypothetical protein